MQAPVHATDWKMSNRRLFGALLLVDACPLVKCPDR